MYINQIKLWLIVIFGQLFSGWVFTRGSLTEEALNEAD